MRRYLSVISLLYNFHVASPSVLTQYNGLESDYWKWKESFSPKTSSLGYVFGYFRKSPDPDPIQYDESQKKALCSSFIQANNYVYVKAEMGSLVKSGKPKNTHLNDFAEFSPEEETRDVMIGSQKDSLKMFRCTTDIEDKHTFYLTFALKKDYAFVVSTVKNKEEKPKNVVVQALLQPDATIQEEVLRHEGAFVTTFWDNVQKAISNIDNQTLKNLCFMSEYHHFNICSVVADTLYRKKEFPKFQLNRTMNYVYRFEERCASKKIGDAEGKSYEEDVMPCAINDETGSEPQFYLLRHVTSADLHSSVYVMTMGEGEILRLLTRVDNVIAMTMPY